MVDEFSCEDGGDHERGLSVVATSIGVATHLAGGEPLPFLLSGVWVECGHGGRALPWFVWLQVVLGIKTEPGFHPVENTYPGDS